MEAVSARLRVRSSPGAKRAVVVGQHGGAWKVRVAEPAEGGRANEAMLSLLSRTLSLPRDAVTLVSGAGAQDKIVELVGLGPSEIERRLSAGVGKERGG